MNDKPDKEKIFKPHTYRVFAAWTGDRTWQITSEGTSAIDGGSPVSSGGPPGRWPPGELLLASINSCLLASFVGYCLRKNFEFVSYESETEGLLENDGVTIRFTKMTIRPRVAVKNESDVETARAYIQRAHKMCFMAHSVNADIAIEPTVIAVEQEK